MFNVACDGQCPGGFILGDYTPETRIGCECASVLAAPFTCASAGLSGISGWDVSSLSEGSFTTFRTSLRHPVMVSTSAPPEIPDIFAALMGRSPFVDCTNNTPWDVDRLSCPLDVKSNSCIQCENNGSGNVIAGIIAVAGGAVMATCTAINFVLEIYERRRSAVNAGLKLSAWAQSQP